MYQQDIQDPENKPKKTELLRPFPTCVTQKAAFVELLSHVPEIAHLKCFAFTSLVEYSVSTTDTASICEKPALPT